MIAWIVAAAGLAAQPAPPPAAAAPAASKFVIADSPLRLTGDVRPRQYIGVVGRRAAWLGNETGEAELWVHPLKLATRFQLDFRIPDYLEPVRGADVARTIDVRPELTTITYSHATFTVRQHVLAPLDRPGLLVLLDVETVRPLEIIASFRTAFQLAWPGSLGGQYTTWNATEKAFLLSESLRRHNAYIGSPWATTASDHPAHALPDAPSTFVIPVDRDRAGRELIPIAIAAGIAPRDEVLAVYRDLLARPEALYRERRAHADRLRTELVSIDTPDDRLDLAFEWGKVNLDEQLVCNPDLGCGLVAGWGPSGESARPGFGWFFGGDAAINSFAMSAIGMGAEVEAGLRFLAKFQRADGKIPHEISQAAARLPWFTDYPYPYYHADTTPYWIVAVWRAWRASGSDALLGDLWPALTKAWAWCLSTETDGDGLIENTTGGLGAIEVGAIGENVHQDIYLAGVWVQAIQAMKEMAIALGATQANEAVRLEPLARRSLNEKYWLSAAGHHAFGILRSGRTSDTLTVWPATAAAFGLFDRERGRQTMSALAGHSLTADWGARMLTTASPLYDPLHYNMGAVWPFVTGFVAWGHYAYGRPYAGYPLIEALARLTFDFARGRHAELLSGRFYRPLDTAVPHQFFATAMLVTPIMSGLLGWTPDAPGQRATLAPQLPPEWSQVTIRNLPVGTARLNVTLRQTGGRIAVEVGAVEGSATISFSPMLPPGARPMRAAGTAQVGTQVLQADPRAPARGEVRWTGGLSVSPVTPELQPGDQSTGLRVLDLTWNGATGSLVLEGLAGRRYQLRLIGDLPRFIAPLTPVRPIPGGQLVEITMPTGAAITRTVVRLAK